MTIIRMAALSGLVAMATAMIATRTEAQSQTIELPARANGYAQIVEVPQLSVQAEAAPSTTCQQCSGDYQRIETGVPILSNIPYVGRLFKNVGLASPCDCCQDPSVQAPAEGVQASGLTVQPTRNYTVPFRGGFAIISNQPSAHPWRPVSPPTASAQTLPSQYYLADDVQYFQAQPTTCPAVSAAVPAAPQMYRKVPPAVQPCACCTPLVASLTPAQAPAAACQSCPTTNCATPNPFSVSNDVQACASQVCVDSACINANCSATRVSFTQDGTATVSDESCCPGACSTAATGCPACSNQQSTFAFSNSVPQPNGVWVPSAVGRVAIGFAPSPHAPSPHAISSHRATPAPTGIAPEVVQLMIENAVLRKSNEMIRALAEVQVEVVQEKASAKAEVLEAFTELQSAYLTELAESKIEIARLEASLEMAEGMQEAIAEMMAMHAENVHLMAKIEQLESTPVSKQSCPSCSECTSVQASNSTAQALCQRLSAVQSENEELHKRIAEMEAEVKALAARNREVEIR